MTTATATAAIAEIEEILTQGSLTLESPGDAAPTTFQPGEGALVLEYLVLFSDLENVSENLTAEIASFAL